MTKDEWKKAFNQYLTARMEDVDDDVFVQVAIVDRYLEAWGKLPDRPGDLQRVYKALAIYKEAIQSIGAFPET